MQDQGWTHIIVARQKAPEVRLGLWRDPFNLAEAGCPPLPVPLCESQTDFQTLDGQHWETKGPVTVVWLTHTFAVHCTIRNDWQCLVPSPFTGPTLPLSCCSLMRNPFAREVICQGVTRWVLPDQFLDFRKMYNPPLSCSTSLVTPWPSRLLPGYSHHPHPVSSYSLNGVQFWSGAYDKLSSGPALEDSCTHLKHI